MLIFCQLGFSFRLMIYFILFYCYLMIRSDDPVRWSGPMIRSDDPIRWSGPMIRSDDPVRWSDPMIRSRFCQRRSNWPFWKGYSLCLMADFQNRLISQIFGVFSSGFLHTTTLTWLKNRFPHVFLNFNFWPKLTILQRL